MSIINIRTCYDIMAALNYQQTQKGKDRCAAKRSNIEPLNFNNLARMVIESAGRKVQGYTVIQAFSTEELLNTPENIELVNLIGCEFASRAFYGCPYQVVTHTDSKSGHLHNHISVLNYDLETGHCITRDVRWLYLSRANDALMRDYGLEVCNAKTRQADQKAYFDKQHDPDKYIWQEDLQNRVQKALDYAVSPGDFASRLKAEGVQAKMYGKNGKPLKHMVFIFNGTDGKEHRKRGNNMNLGNEFSHKALTEVFKQNAEKAKQLTLDGISTAMGSDDISTGKIFTPEAANAVIKKASSKTAGKENEAELHTAIKKKKQEMDEEEEKKRMRLQLLQLKEETKKKQDAMQKIQEQLNHIGEAIDSSEDAEETGRLEKEEKQLEKQFTDLEKELLYLSVDEKKIKQFLSGKQALDPQLELGYQMNRQKQRGNEGMSMLE